jgi:hypothetical protein
MRATVTAPTVSALWPALDQIKADLRAISTEHGVSEVLLLTTLKDFCDRRLTSVIDSGR